MGWETGWSTSELIRLVGGFGDFYNDSMKLIFLFLETCDITQVDLKLVILLPQLPEHWDCRLGTLWASRDSSLVV